MTQISGALVAIAWKTTIWQSLNIAGILGLAILIYFLCKKNK